MALQYLLDGYNIVRNDAFQKYRCSSSSGIDELQRVLYRCRPQGRNRATIIVDGYPPTNRLHRMDGIIYTRSLSADEVIVRLVRSSPHPASIRVVTDDRSLRRDIRAAGATWVGVAAFLAACDADGAAVSETDDDEKPAHSSAEGRRLTEELARIWETGECCQSRRKV